MIWRGNNRRIYVLYNGDGWGSYQDTWQDGMNPETCVSNPIRGFGRVWCNNDAVRQGMGTPLERETERSDSATIQDFANGLIIRLSGGRTYVLTVGGGWRS